MCLDKVWASDTGTCTGAIPNYTVRTWFCSEILLDELLTTSPGHSQTSHLVRGLYKESVIFLVANTLGDDLNMMLAWVLYAKVVPRIAILIGPVPNQPSQHPPNLMENSFVLFLSCNFDASNQLHRLCFALVNITEQRLAVELQRTYVYKKGLTQN
ncbi:hypothetical protein BJ138DRAFT_1096959 [Hygrophoropsis aurantiaca]|uniref:Uncharacterized protein n=1 Tax=Hygrophoropsis aurantiaca TaxID=72124 RepID=A0ACB8AU50_9AGAM|nr:hypothetical protein BJ138DRAFT_1096959 [Hygrophoropsis aurantiaca]